MARPVNADAEATRQKVLDAAGVLFAEHGVDGTSIREVARGAGVSLGLVHHYFGNKDGLYQASIEAMYAELDPLREQFDAALAAGGDLRALVDRVVRAGFRFVCAHRAEIKLMMRTVVDTGEVEPRWRDTRQLPFLARTSALLEPLFGRPASELRLVIQSLTHLAIRYGLTSPRELALVAGLGNSGSNGSAHGSASKRHDAAIEAIENHLVDMALRMLGMPETTTARPARDGRAKEHRS